MNEVVSKLLPIEPYKNYSVFLTLLKVMTIPECDGELSTQRRKKDLAISTRSDDNQPMEAGKQQFFILKILFIFH